MGGVKYDIPLYFPAYVHDNAYPKLYDWCNVIVQVDDVNDHTPYFLHREFFQTVPENLQDRNASIFQVLAQDADIGDNARITYSITSEYSDQPVTCLLITVPAFLLFTCLTKMFLKYKLLNKTSNRNSFATLSAEFNYYAFAAVFR